MEEERMETREIRKHFSKLGFMFLLGTLIIYGASRLTGWICKDMEVLQNNTNLQLLVSMIPMYLIGMPAMIWLIKRIPAETIPVKTMKKSHYALAVLMCIALLEISNLVGVLITSAIGAFKGSQVDNELLGLLSGANLGVTFLLTVIFAPVYEEYIFRKLIVDRAVGYGKGLAVMLSGLMFGLFHGNMNQFVYATATGMFFAFIYVKTGKLRYSIGLHMVMNLIGGVFGMIILRMLKYEELLELVQTGASDGVMMKFIMENLPGWIVYMAYLFIIFGVCITGLVLFIVFRKRFALPVEQGDVPKGDRLVTMLGNVGMFCFMIYWIWEIIKQLMK